MKSLSCSLLFLGALAGCSVKSDGFGQGDDGAVVDDDTTATTGPSPPGGAKDAVARDGAPTATPADAILPPAFDAGAALSADAVAAGPPDPPVTEPADAKGASPDGLAAAVDTRPIVDAPREIVASAPKMDAPTHPSRALLITSGQPLQAGDIALRTRLSALGFQVTAVQVDSVDNVRALRGRLSEVDMLVISSSYNSTIGESATLADATIPIVCLEMLMLPQLRMVTSGNDAGWLAADTRVQITRADHPLASGLPAGPAVVATAARMVGWGRALPSAAVVATVVGAADQATIFGYEKGAALTQKQAPARRVGWFGHVTMIPALNATGRALFDAAVLWAAGVSVL